MFMKTNRKTHPKDMSKGELMLCPRQHLAAQIIGGNFLKVLERQR